MRRLSLVLALASLAAAVPAVLADSISYPHAGTPASPVTLVASNSGDVVGYFIGQDAGDISVVRMVNVTTGVASNYYFPNQITAPGTSQNFGAVNKGDVLAFELYDLSIGASFSTDPSANVDGVTHGYVTSFSGGLLGSSMFPAGTFIGMEDRPWSDYDYNDNRFLFTNVGVASTPEPGSLVLLGTGILGIAGAMRRKMYA